MDGAKKGIGWGTLHPIRTEIVKLSGYAHAFIAGVKSEEHEFVIAAMVHDIGWFTLCGIIASDTVRKRTDIKGQEDGQT